MITATYRQQHMKAYADDSAKGRGHYRDVSAYLDACRKIFDDYCDGKPADQQVHTWRGLLRVPWKLATHDALLAEDMPALNDALFHFAAAEGCRNWTGSTPDYAYPTVKTPLGCGDVRSRAASAARGVPGPRHVGTHGLRGHGPLARA